MLARVKSDIKVSWVSPIRELHHFTTYDTYHNLFKGTIDFIWKHQGVRGFYRGLGPTLLGYLPSWGIYFLVYDGAKRAFGEAPDSQSKKTVFFPAAQVKGYQPVMREHPWSLHLLSAMAAGTASTLATNPLWVVKTRFMVRLL